MTPIDYDKTFWNLSSYQPNKTLGSMQGSTVIPWIKEENGQRFLEVSRIEGLWEQIMTIGLINTILRWFDYGDASISGVMAFLNQEDVKREIKVKYLNQQYTDTILRINNSILALNCEASTTSFDLGCTKTEIDQQKIRCEEREKSDQEWAAKRRAEEEIEREKAAEVARKKEEEKIKNRSPFDDEIWHDLPISPPFSSPSSSSSSSAARGNDTYVSSSSSSSSSGNGTSYISSSETVNGKTTSYSDTFSGSGSVSIDNGNITVRGKRII